MLRECLNIEGVVPRPDAVIPCVIGRDSEDTGKETRFQGTARLRLDQEN